MFSSPDIQYTQDAGDEMAHPPGIIFRADYLQNQKRAHTENGGFRKMLSRSFHRRGRRSAVCRSIRLPFSRGGAIFRVITLYTKACSCTQDTRVTQHIHPRMHYRVLHAHKKKIPCFLFIHFVFLFYLPLGRNSEPGVT